MSICLLLLCIYIFAFRIFSVQKVQYVCKIKLLRAWMEFSYPAAQQSFLASVCFHDENCSNFCKQKFFQLATLLFALHHVYEKKYGVAVCGKMYLTHESGFFLIEK